MAKNLEDSFNFLRLASQKNIIQLARLAKKDEKIKKMFSRLQKEI